MAELSKSYNPKEVESKIYERWEASGFFNPDTLPRKRRKPFVVSMPPPNITGELHFGHALGMTIQDILIRFERMRGRATLWLPGTDHAAISTQVVVERKLREQGIDRRKIGREKFLARVWKWKEEYGSRIVEQIKRMGASADWSRLRFTMDEQLTDAVYTAFKKLHDDGLIYRGERIINWCPECQTAVSDLEVDKQETPGTLTYIRYPLTDGSGHITVATTRPETMLGDTAVAVHPEDPRYKHLVGKTVKLPIVGRDIPIVADDRIDKAFGTGAVKVTPAHDPLDFEIGQTHSLPRITIIGFDGRMTEAAGSDYSGAPVLAVRAQVVAKLQALGVVEKIEDYVHAVGYCQRSKTMIEPLVSLQWFVKMKPLAEQALAAVRSGKIKIVPGRFEKVYFRWLENIRDWNISRQIWWGHRLPVWYQGEKMKVSAKSPGSGWKQDQDTLDTWFSSGLWTFSTLGWPKKTADLKKFHPTSVMVTGWDILFFWVARMVMFSLYLKQEIPFHTIYLHGLVLDTEGKKMSKSKGTGIDPIPLAERYGMDAVRMSLIIGNAPGQDFRLYEKKIEGYRNFANKLWNISRFVFSTPRPSGSLKSKSLADAWILSKLQGLVQETTAAIEGFEFSRAGQALYDFVWHDFADWYIELSKVYPNPGVQYHVLETILRMLHPLMPFITEEIWSTMHPDSLLMVADWPAAKRVVKGATSMAQFTNFQKTVVALRNFRIHSELPAGAAGKYRSPRREKIEAAALQALTRVAVQLEDRLEPTGGYKEVYLGPTQFQFQAEYVDRYQAWVEKERTSLQAYAAQLEQKLGNEQFVQHAKPEVVEQEKQKLAEAKQRLLEL